MISFSIHHFHLSYYLSVSFYGLSAFSFCYLTQYYNIIVQLFVGHYVFGILFSVSQSQCLWNYASGGIRPLLLAFSTFSPLYKNHSFISRFSNFALFLVSQVSSVHRSYILSFSFLAQCLGIRFAFSTSLVVYLRGPSFTFNCCVVFCRVGFSVLSL